MLARVSAGQVGLYTEGEDVRAGIRPVRKSADQQINQTINQHWVYTCPGTQ